MGKLHQVMQGNTMFGIHATEFKGKKYVDVRKYYKADGEYKPTPKGLMVPVEVASDIIGAMASCLKNDFDTNDALLPAKVYCLVSDAAMAGSKPKLLVPEIFVFEDLASAKATDPNEVEKDSKRLNLVRVKYGSVVLKEDKYSFRDPEITPIGVWSRKKNSWRKAKTS